jgi:hypothetical protein
MVSNKASYSPIAQNYNQIQMKRLLWWPAMGMALTKNELFKT